MKLTKMMFVVWALSLCGFASAAAPKIGVLKPEVNAVSALLSPASGHMKRQDGRPGQISLVALGDGKYRGTFASYDEAGAQLWLDFDGKFIHASEEDVRDGNHLGFMEAGLMYAPDGERPEESFRYGTINLIWETPTAAVVRVKQDGQEAVPAANYEMSLSDDTIVIAEQDYESPFPGAFDFSMRVRVEDTDGSVYVIESVAHFSQVDILNLSHFVEENPDHEIYSMQCWVWGNCKYGVMSLLLDGLDCKGHDHCEVVLFWNKKTRTGTLEAMVRPAYDWKTWHRNKKAATGVVMSTRPDSLFPMAGVGMVAGDKAISYELIPIHGSTGWFKEELPVIEGIIINSMSTSNGG